MKNNKKNVLFIEFLEKTSALHLLPIFKEIKKTNSWTIYLLGEKNSYLAKESQKLGIKTYTIKYKEFNIHKLDTYSVFVKTILLLTIIVLKHKISILHCHRLNWAYLGIIVSKIFDLPIYIDIVYLERLTSKIQTYLITKHTKNIFLAVSNDTRQKFHSIYNIPLSRIHIFCGGINIPTRTVFNTELSRKIPTIIAMVSRLDPLKGVDIFIEAAGILKNKWKNIHFLFIGHQKHITWSEHYYENCLSRIHNLKLDKQFTIKEFTHDMENFYPKLYCTVLPTMKDALAYSALESMAYKKPIIITNIDGTPEAVNNGKAGILIPYPPSPVILAKEIDQLLSNHKYYAYFSEQGYLWVKEKYSAQKNVRLLTKLYEKNILNFKN